MNHQHFRSFVPRFRGQFVLVPMVSILERVHCMFSLNFLTQCVCSVILSHYFRHLQSTRLCSVRYIRFSYRSSSVLRWRFLFKTRPTARSRPPMYTSVCLRSRTTASAAQTLVHQIGGNLRQRGHLCRASRLLYARARLHVKIREVTANHRDRKCDNNDATNRAHCSDNLPYFGHGDNIPVPQSGNCHDSPPKGFWDTREHFFVGVVLREVNHTGE